MRERWFGATGRRVPELALAGNVELGDALVLDGVDDVAVARAAFGLGVGVAPLSHYYGPDTPAGDVRRGLLLSFGPSGEHEVRSAVAALARALKVRA